MVQPAQQKDNPPAPGRAVAAARSLSVSRQPTEKDYFSFEVRFSPPTPNLGLRFLFDFCFVLHFLGQMLNLYNLEEVDPHAHVHADRLSRSPEECE